ncbi:MAG: SGNH/GDSL hydrolase family protein [Polyangiales bacterium]
MQLRRLAVSARLAFAAAVLGGWGSASAIAQSDQEPVDEGDAAPSARWIATWTAAQQTPVVPSETPSYQDQTLRQIVHISVGGSSLRVRLSNAYGTTPLKIGAATVALSAGRNAIVPESLRPLTFGDEASTTIPVGAVAISDPVALTVSEQADLAISVYLPEATLASTQLTMAHQTSYVFGPGDYTAGPSPAAQSVINAWYWLSGVEVRRRRGGASVVAFGDSITEGYGSTEDGNNRWPDALARRLLACGADIGVANSGISGNRVLNEELGPNALRRLDRDLLVQGGVRWAILLEGINDLSFSSAQGAFPPSVVLTEVSAADVIAGYRQIVRQAHAKGIRVFAGTLLPVGGAFPEPNPIEGKREAINTWLRGDNPFDGVIDFDVALRDPALPTQLLAAYDSGDHVHPNDAGYAAMADAVDLSLLGVTQPDGSACE